MALTETIQNALLGGALGAFIAAALILFILIVIAIWIYTSFAWMKIGKRLKYKYSWLAWIPFARTAMIFEMGNFHWALALLWLIPILGWAAIGVLCLIASWRIFEKRNYSGWLALVPILMVVPILSWFAGVAYLIIIGFVAWKDQKKRR